MACKGIEHAIEMVNASTNNVAVKSKQQTEQEATSVEKLIFGVDSKNEASDIQQNNLSLFEWATRNKACPIFWGRNIIGENALTKDEIEFIHSNGCKIVPVYNDSAAKVTFEEGKIVAEKIDSIALQLSIPIGTVIFLEIPKDEEVSRDYLVGFAEGMSVAGYTPGFKANTDAMYGFDRAFSQGLQTDREILERCLIWAVTPSLPEYDRVTTTHLIHPDSWKPFAPSGIKRKDIAIWQYGKNCHPIDDDKDIETTFNINLVRNEKIIIEKMF